MTAFPFTEKHLSQIPALQLLVNLGYQYVPSERALRLRGGRLGNVILDEVLREQLKRINRIAYKGGEYLFSEENVQSAIQQLKSVRYDGLQRTNENVYDLLTLGTTLEQTIEGDSTNPDLRRIIRGLMGAALDNNPPEWEYCGYPNAGRPAEEPGSPSARSIAQLEGLSSARGRRAS